MIKDNKFEDMFAYRDNFAAYKHVESILVHKSNMTATPLISIMIPTYNRPHFLVEAIESALNQKTDIPFEVVVVDNGQDQEMAKKVNEVVASFDASNLALYRNSENIGMFGNWNRCIELARSEYLTILNDDDRLDINWISNAIKYSEDDKIVAFDYQTFGSKNQRSKLRVFLDTVIRKLRPRESTINLSSIFYHMPVAGSLAAMIKKTCAISLGGYNEKFWPTSDYVFVVRYWLKFGLKIVHKIGGYYKWEENESLKEEVLNSFVKNDYMLRVSMLLHFIIKSKSRLKILYFISLAQAIVQSYGNEKNFPHSDFKANDLISSEFNINSKFVLKFLRAVLLLHFINTGFNVLLRLMWKLFLPNNQKTLSVLKLELEHINKISNLRTGSCKC